MPDEIGLSMISNDCEVIVYVKALMAFWLTNIQKNNKNCHDSQVQANACSAVGLSFALQRSNRERKSFN